MKFHVKYWKKNGLLLDENYHIVTLVDLQVLIYQIK